jgi:hypothetical protein
MNKKNIKIIGITGVLALALLGGVFVYREVSAQTPTPGAPLQPGRGGGYKGDFMGETSNQDLAIALGIDAAKLQTAYKEANIQALKDAVSKGLLTQQQADQLSARGLDQHPLGGFGRLGSGIDYDTLLANALGISVDKLQAATQQVINTNLDNAVKSGRITQEQADLAKARSALAGNAKFQTALQTAFTDAVNQAVKDGIITQAQADLVLKAGNGEGFPGGFRGPAGFNEFRGPGG